MSTQSKQERAMQLRIKALYHNCMSSAAFKREESLKTDNENEATCLRREASAFECVAMWLHHAVGTMPTNGGGQ